ncbi:MAG: hypothetical protein KJ734_02000, partial [Chloroflexi bacterium]|nr:hypothetical protein [Chloroflexota bacterium]
MLDGSRRLSISWKLLTIPIILHVLAGLTILLAPGWWSAYFTELAKAYPDVSDIMSQFMAVIGLAHLLVVVVFLIVLSAYRKRARWAWWTFLFAFTFGWGADFVLEVSAGIAWAIFATAAVIL